LRRLRGTDIKITKEAPPKIMRSGQQISTIQQRRHVAAVLPPLYT